MPPTPSFSARRHGAQADGPAWALALSEEPWAADATLLKEDRSRAGRGVRVLAATLRGRSVVLKFYRYRRRLDRARARLGLAAGDRHWAGAALLAAEGIACAPMLALLSRTEAGVREDCLVMGRLEGQTLLAWMDQASRGEVPLARQHALADAVGLQVGCLLAAGLHNRDHKPSNLIVSFEATDPAAPPIAAPTTPPTVAVADCQGVRRLERDKSRHAIRTQASLALEAIGAGVLPRRAIIARTLHAAVAAYTARRFGGVPVERALRLPKAERDAVLAALPRGTALAAWPRIAERIRVHGDPTPRVDPLAPPATT